MITNSIFIWRRRGGGVALGEGGGDLIVNVSYDSTLLREILIVASVISMHQPPVSHVLHSMVDLLSVIVTFSFCQERPNFNEILSELKSMSGDGRYNSINN